MRHSGEKELREQLHQEIEDKSKSCSNPTYECTIPRIDGYDYCIRHILRDSRGNYRQCAYSFSNGRKCPNAVLKHDIKKDPALTNLCFEHNRQLQLQKTHSVVGKLHKVDSNEALLNSLAHHINVEEDPEKTSACEQDEEIDVVSPHVAPFQSYEQIHGISVIDATVRKRRRVLDYASDSSSGEEETVCLANTAGEYECHESDKESTDSQDEDLLKHAAVYTRQEAIRISETKLTKLQGLYITQINRLHYLLKERRRCYLHTVRKERETLCSIHDQLKDTPQERILYKKLKALNTYHRRNGVEAVLYKKYKDKRSRYNDVHSCKGPGQSKCIYSEGGVKCGERTLPCTKHCRKHILEDKKQTLFRACEVEKSSVVCQESTPCVFDDSTCILHFVISNQRQYIQKKYESETEDEEGETKIDSASAQKGEILKQKENCNSQNISNCNVTISHDSNEAIVDFNQLKTEKI